MEKFTDRIEFLKLITSQFLGHKKSLNIIEIGVWKGGLSNQLVTNFPNCLISLIDPWKVSNNFKSAVYSSERVTQAELDKIHSEIKQRFLENENVEVFRGEIKSFYYANQELKADLIYIDGDHSFIGCYEDLVFSDKLTQKGALIVIDDYTLEGWWEDGVITAVNCFLGSNSDRYVFQSRFYNQLVLRKLKD